MEYLRLEAIINIQLNFKIIEYNFNSKMKSNLPLICHFHYPMLVRFINNQKYLIRSYYYIFNLNFDR
jgi:hypothetical protein